MTFLMACSKDSSESTTRSDTGVGGSTARFVVVNDRLYTVDHAKLHIFDVSTPSSPVEVQESDLQSQLNGSIIETIFAKGNILFIGTQSGISMFNISNPDAIEKYTTYSHIVSCDPVVADDSCAYSTLSAGRAGCWSGTNSLDIINIKDLYQPMLIKTYPMKNPKGLGLLGNRLFVCDEGVKVYDITNPGNIVLKRNYLINADDVIPLPNSILFTGSDGLLQYVFFPANDSLVLASRIIVTKG